MSALLVLMLLGACDPYASVARTDTIEAYEAYLADHADGPNAFRSQIRLEELYLADARASGALADWDAYLERFPEGNHREAALKEREASLFAHARWEASVASWQQFLDQYPKAERKRRGEAEEGLEAARYAAHLQLGEVVIDAVNLAEDPEGPLNGKRYRVEVQNAGERVIETLWLRIHYLDDAGRPVGERRWPVVAKQLEFPVPVEEEKTVPMQPGETRTWTWTTGDLPEGHAGKTRVVPVEIRFAAVAEVAD